MSKEALFKDIANAVVDMDADSSTRLCQTSIEQRIAPYETITGGLMEGMKEVSRLYEEEEYFLPEVLMSSEAMNAGLDVLNPHLDKSSMGQPIKVVIGVVEGDTHDIGKNLVRIMTESSGMEIYDLGRDVPLEKFISKAEEVDADVIAMSTLMTSTMDGMKEVIDRLKQRNIRDKYKVMVGGGPISPRFAQRIGADLYSKDAAEAVRTLKTTFGKEQ
ncbi:MAG: corrinoid protein [Acidobacteriota bacterium]|jgi:dimethylamine corrinoid protein|nr:corrinoid protein [Acidobacteriota bacterium]